MKAQESGAGASEQEDEAEERFYVAHQEELLTAMKGGHGFSGGEMFNRLEPRAEGGVGIANQGATCYMNSLLQVLFHTPEFRAAIYCFCYDTSKHGDEARCIPLQLQRLFARMQLSQAAAVSTSALTDACGMSGRTGEQHDVQELCRVLFDALGRSSAQIRKDIERLYGGRVVQYVRTQEPHDGITYESSRKESILDLQVPILCCVTLEEALCKLVEPEELAGENQWQCDELGRKVDALKGLEFESLPHILHLQLMRFIFDFVSMSRKKVTDSLSIPLQLDARCLLGPSAEPVIYELSGLCVQFGTAEGGHYVAKVRDASTGRWLDANDRVVSVLSPEQVASLFHPRQSTDSSSAAAEAAGSDGHHVVALDSTDAYYLVYRRAALEKPAVQDQDVPSDVAEEILSENDRLKVLQRAYALHRQLWEVRVFAPSAASQALRRYAAGMLDGLLAEGQLEGGSDGELQSVVVSAPRTKTISAVLRKALVAFAEKGASGADWAWGADLAGPATPVARLRKYDARYGDVQEPLDGCRSLTDCFGENLSRAQVVAILELPGPGEEFEPWEDGAKSFIACRWCHQSRAACISCGDLRVLRLLPEKLAAGTAVPAPAAKGSDLVPREDNPAYDPCSDEMPDLFGDSAVLIPTPPAGDATVALKSIRSAAALALGLDNVAIVPMTGNAAGRALVDDDMAAEAQGVACGDILCVEAVIPGEELKSIELYELKRNSAHLSFNHPDRPQYTEEFKLSISKSATVEDLKSRIAQELGLESSKLHLRREQGQPQMKDESRTLASLGLGDCSSVFVGHGAPCPTDHTMLAAHLFWTDGASCRSKVADFHVSARGLSTVLEFREAVAEHVLEWARNAAAVGDGGEPPIPLEGFSWRRLRLRDVKAGSHDAILRDEKSLRSALPCFVDGRQVGIQVLSHGEQLLPEEAVVMLRVWLVGAGRLLQPVEAVVSKLQSLGDFRQLLEARFEELRASAQLQCESAAQKDPEGSAAAEGSEAGGDEPDRLEVAVLPPQPGTMGPKHCASLKWADSRLNATGTEALAKPLSELKEIRDGVVLVLRSRLDALRAAASTTPQQSGASSKAGKGRGKGPAPKATAKGYASVEEGAAAISANAPGTSKKAQRKERGVHIEVVCPMMDEDADAPGE